MGTGKKLGVGVLGAASIAKKNVRAIGKNKNGAEVVAIGSRNISKAQAFIDEMKLGSGVKAYGSYEEVLADPRVDAVYLPLPTAIHVPWVRKAAAQGKHILLEKPIALTVEETDELVAIAKEAGVQLMDGTMWAMREALDSFDGGVTSVTSTFTWGADEYFMENDVRTRKDGDALGSVGDVGWYCIRSALWAYKYDKPAYVQAHPGARFNKNGVIMHGGGTVVWPDGRILNFDSGFDTVHSMYLQMAGPHGMVELDDFCIPYDEESCTFRVKGDASWDDYDTSLKQPISEKTIHMDRPQETFMWEAFADFVYAIQDGGAPNTDWTAQAAICNKVVIAIVQSAEQGCKRIDLNL